VVVSDFVWVVGVYQSDENQSDIPTLHRCNILSCVVDFLTFDFLTLWTTIQVEFSCSIWALVPVGHVPGVAA